MPLFFFLFFISFVYSPPFEPPPSPTCGYFGSVYSADSDTCIRSFISDGKNAGWKSSRTKCKDWHPAADLVVIKNGNHRSTINALVGSYDSVFVGLHDIMNEAGTDPFGFEWVDKSTGNWDIEWAAGTGTNPSNSGGGEDCCEILFAWDYDINDNNCGISSYVICEFSMNDIEETVCSQERPWVNVRYGNIQMSNPYHYCDDATCPYCPTDGNYCNPPCVHGTCTYNNENPNFCTCDKGFGGAACDQCNSSRPAEQKWKIYPNCDQCLNEYIDPDSDCTTCIPSREQFYDYDTDCKYYYSYDDYNECPIQQYVKLRTYIDTDINDCTSQFESFTEYWPSKRCINVGFKAYTSVKYSCSYDGTIRKELFADFNCKGKFEDTVMTPSQCYDHKVFKDGKSYRDIAIKAYCGVSADDVDMLDGVSYFLHDYEDYEDENDCNFSLNNNCVMNHRSFPSHVDSHDCGSDYFSIGSSAYEGGPYEYSYTCLGGMMNITIYEDVCNGEVKDYLIFPIDQCEHIDHNYNKFQPPYGFPTTSENKYGLRWNRKFNCPL